MEGADINQQANFGNGAGSIFLLEFLALREKRCQTLAFPANGDFFVPAFPDVPFADGSGYKPAKGPRSELPGGAQRSAPGRASLDFPANRRFYGCIPPSKIKEQYLPFHMGGNGSPALFVAVNRF